jgi:hypothetical protein
MFFLRKRAALNLVDPKFRRSYRQYLFQASLATVSMIAILLFVDSLSTAAIAAGLGSSRVGIFINSTGATSRVHSVAGGHTLALLLGSISSFISFAGSIESFIADHSGSPAVVMGIFVGLLILAMAVTATERPPAAGIAIGMFSHEWTLEVFEAILGNIVLLGVNKLVFECISAVSCNFGFLVDHEGTPEYNLARPAASQFGVR